MLHSFTTISRDRDSSLDAHPAEIFPPGEKETAEVRAEETVTREAEEMRRKSRTKTVAGADMKEMEERTESAVPGLETMQEFYTKKGKRKESS